MRKTKGFAPVVILVVVVIGVCALGIGYAIGHKGSLPIPIPTIPVVSTLTKTENDVSLNAHTELINIHSIPLGDGRVSASPKVGYVYSCQTSFNGGGAEHAGNWIQGDTWDLTQKISVQGSVSWPNAQFSESLSGVSRVLSGNGLPVGSSTGTFPISKNDPAYQYDRNPNSISAQDIVYQLSSNPQIATNAICVPMGAIGYALNGVAIYNSLDEAGRDAVAHEVQDSCDGHPQQSGEYHYHGPSDCMPHADENNMLIGYALDGFGIYSRYDASGKEYTNADLDECHGITSEVEWNGEKVTMYHYVLTQEYPYTIGCFRGIPVKTHASNLNQGTVNRAMQQGGGTPPQIAIDACLGEDTGVTCSFSTPNGLLTGTCTQVTGNIACVPN